jgi:hypothetical protein
MGNGERDLARLLATLEPRLDPEAYLFVRLDERDLGRLGGEARGLFREAEGWTVVVSRATAERLGLEASGAPLWARIELTVHSDLEAVGLLAAVATRLAAAGVSVNPWAGWHHDHLFVPWARRQAALDALRALQAAASAAAPGE